MNPWKGLDTYHEGEVLYGRDEDIRKLSQCVLGYDDTVLYGRSGIGKSSLLNAGILPAARIAGFVPVYIRLNHENEEAYFKQVQDAIEEVGVRILPVSSVKNDAQPLFWELFHRNRFILQNGENAKLLLIFDQFEEIFTLQQNADARRRFFYQMGSVLNKVKPDELENSAAEVSDALPLKQESVLKTGLVMKVRKTTKGSSPNFVNDNIVHFVFTLREDFLSDFEYYTSAIPSLKQHRYGLRPINEEQASEIILRPRRGLVSKEVAKLIIEKVTQRADFELDGIPEIEVDSAVLSLYMNRLYESHQGDEITAGLVEEKGGAIIKDFYERSIEDIDRKAIEYLENTLVNDDNRRENTSLSTVSKTIGQANVDKLIGRCILRKFVLGGDYKVEFIHDILCPVVKEKKEQRLLLALQEEERRKQEEEKQRAIAEEKRKREEAERENARIQRKTKKKVRAFFMFVCLLGIATVFCLVSFLMEFSANYSSFTFCNGWPVGVGKPLVNTKGHACYYKLSKKGWLTKNYTRVDVVNQEEGLTINTLSTPIVQQNEKYDTVLNVRDFASLLGKVKRISFEESSSDAKMASKQIFFDNHNRILFVKNYSSVEEGLGKTKRQWCTFTKSTGMPLKVREQADRMQITLDSLGYEKQYMFFDALGHPCNNFHEWCYGVLRNYDELSHELAEEQYLDAFGNVLCTKKNKYIGNVLVEDYDCSQELSDIDYTSIKTTFAKNGNVKEKVYLKKQKLVKSETHPAVVSYAYYDNGLLKEEKSSDGKGNLVSGKEYNAYSKFGYDSFTFELTSRILKDVVNGDTMVIESYKKDKNHEYTSSYDEILNAQILETKTLRQGKTVNVRYTCNGKPICHPTFKYYEARYVYESLSYHGIKCNKTVCKYYDTLRNLCEKYSGNSESLPPHAIEEKWEDSQNNLIRHIVKNKYDKVIFSMGYEYNENGTLNKQYVVGVEDTPIRCPHWERDGLCYYQLQVVRDFDWNISRLSAVGENGRNNSLVYFGLQGQQMVAVTQKQKETEIGNGWQYITWEQFLQTPKVNVENAKKVYYLHLFSKNNKLHDGDILVGANSVTDRMSTAHLQTFLFAKRYNQGLRKWEKITNVTLRDIQQADAEYYPIYVSSSEYNEINN